MKIITNADDFGLSAEANQGVIHAMKEGYCSQTSIVTNSNYFDEAVELAQKNHLMEKVGLHINLFEGTPLTSNIRKIKDYAYYDSFRYQPKKYHDLLCTYQSAVSEELEAQIVKYREAGFKLSNIDSHHCAFYDWTVLQALLPLLKKYRFESVRYLGSSFFDGKFLTEQYGKKWLSKMDTLQLKHPDYSSSISTYIRNKQQKVAKLYDANVVEIYLHPVLVGNYFIDNFTGGQKIKESFQNAGLKPGRFMTTKDI